MLDLRNKKILIVRLGKIGDIIISSFVFEALKKKFPGIDISLLTLKTNQEVLKYNPDIDNLILTKKNLSIYFKLLSLRQTNFDLVLDLNDDPSTTSNVIRRLIKAKRIVGFGFSPDEKSKDLIPQPHKDETHIIFRIKHLLNEFGISLTDEEVHPKLYLGSKENSDIVNQLKDFINDKKLVALNISAGAEIRYWKTENWIELIKKIIEKYPEVIFVALTTEKDKLLSDTINNKLNSAKIIKQTFYSLHHYASYICNCDLLISPDTAAVHIGSAFNKPIIALYPDYDWNFVSWQPLSKKFRAIKSKTNFINSISVDEAYNSFTELFEQSFY